MIKLGELGHLEIVFCDKFVIKVLDSTIQFAERKRNILEIRSTRIDSKFSVNNVVKE
jgi:hypothetical protein